MNEKLKELNKLYEHLEVSPKLDTVLQEAILKKRNRKVIYMKKTKKILKTVGTVAAGVVLSVTIGINSSVTFAQVLYKIPVVDDFARLVTFRDYSFENDTSKGKVHIPNVDFETNKDVENKINAIIQEKVDEVLAEQEKLDAEYKKAFLETGGKESEYRKIETTVDYNIGYSDNEILSFEVYKYQTLASAYNENFYYTFDLEKGKQLTIKDLLGDNFAQIVTEKVVTEMKDRVQENPENMYDTDFYESTPIDEGRSFYIDKGGNIVITFAKYEVASGAMGAQEFVVGHIDR